MENVKIFIDGVEEDLKSNDLIVSTKVTKFNNFIKMLGFVDNKITKTERIANFLKTDFSKFKSIADIYLSENIKKMQFKKIKKASGNLGYDVGMLTVCFDNLNYSNEELYKIYTAMKKKVKYVKLNKDTILELDEEISEKIIKTVEEFNLNAKKLNESNMFLYIKV